jgi:crossover junction endodeoxyribonuclease RusA
VIETYTVVLPYRTPPLTLNQRFPHFMVEYRLKAEVKRSAMTMARSLGLPKMKAITAELVWMKADNRTADPDNITATLKPVLDGLVAAGVLPDDNANHVLRTSQKIILKREHNTPGGRVLVRIRDMSALAVTQ